VFINQIILIHSILKFEEYSFEEVRACSWRAQQKVRLEEREKVQAEYEKIIEDLKQKLANAEEYVTHLTQKNAHHTTTTSTNCTKRFTSYADFTNVTQMMTQLHPVSNDLTIDSENDEDISMRKRRREQDPAPIENNCRSLVDSFLMTAPHVLSASNNNTNNATMFNVAAPQNGNMTTFFEKNNKTITARTHEARKMVNKMMNDQTESSSIILDDSSWVTTTTINDVTNTNTAVIRAINNNNESLPTIQIFKDTTVSDMDDDRKKNKGEAINNNHNGQRKALAVLEDNESKINNTNFSTSNVDSPGLTLSTTNTKRLEFEPPAASTRNIKPLLNKMAAQKSSEAAAAALFNIDETFNDKEKSELNLPTELLMNHKQNEQDTNKNSDIIIDESSSERKKSLGLSPIGKSSQTKQVKFNDDLTTFNNFNNNKSPAMTSTQFLSTTKPNSTVQMTQMTQMVNMTWDMGHMQMGGLVADHQEDNSHIRLNNTEFHFRTMCHQKTEKIPTIRIDEDDNNQLLTANKLEETFNNDYYKLCNYTCMNQSTALNLTAQTGPTAAVMTTTTTTTTTTNTNTNTIEVTKYLSEAKQIFRSENEKNNLKPLSELTNKTIVEKNENDEKEEGAAKKEQQKPALQYKQLANLIQNNNSSVNSSSNSTFVVSNLESVNDITSDLSTSISNMNQSVNNMNETIMYAIREPFSYEVKNRLLNRGALNELKQKPNFKSVAVSMPTIKVKTFFLIQDKNYSITEEIGTGAFAKIYLVQNKEDKKQYALKVFFKY
jgi:hypothetical protein